MTHFHSRIAVLGAGRMGVAIIGGLINAGFAPSAVYATCRSAERLSKLHQQFGIHTTSDNRTAVQTAEVVILAVKPAVIGTVLAEIAPTLLVHKPLLISVAAGTAEVALRNLLAPDYPVVCAMPNTSVLVGCSATVSYANPVVNIAEKQLAETIFAAIGTTTWLQEEGLMDIATALCGSGPAYFFLFMESLQEAAEQAGLPKAIAQQLTVQTAYGSAQMAMRSQDAIPQLRQDVAPPGGGTEQAINALEAGGLRQLVATAVKKLL